MSEDTHMMKQGETLKHKEPNIKVLYIKANKEAGLRKLLKKE